MKSLSQSEYGELRSLYEQVYTSPEVEITEELIDEVVDELVEELVEEGYSEDVAYSLVEDATDAYIDEAKVTFGHDTQATRKSGAPVGARRRYGMRKAGEALKGARKAAGDAVDSAKRKAAGAVAGAQIAGSIAKDEARRAGRKAQHSVAKAADTARRAPGEAKKRAKSGIKGFIKRQAQKVLDRVSEENVVELYKGKHGQSDKEYADSRSQGGKMVSGDSKQSGAEYTHGRRVKAENPGMQPDVGGKTKPKSQGKMDSGTRADLEYRKANLKKEELEATGLFTNKEIEAILEAEMSEGYKEIDSAKHNRMYDRYKKLRTAAMKDAAETGEASGDNRYKMGKMQGVISKSAENLRKKG